MVLNGVDGEVWRLEAVDDDGAGLKRFGGLGDAQETQSAEGKEVERPEGRREGLAAQ